MVKMKRVQIRLDVLLRTGRGALCSCFFFAQKVLTLELDFLLVFFRATAMNCPLFFGGESFGS